MINAIFTRKDAKQFLKSTAIGVVPGGSANGYAKTICEASQEAFNEQNCAYIIAKGETRLFDVLEIESASQVNKIYSFLSLTYGLIADIDLESEKLRSLGSARFTVYGMYLLLFRRNYYASLYYADETVIDKDFKFPSLSEELNLKYFKREAKNFAYFYACCVPWVADYINVAPKSLPDDGACDLIVIKKYR